MNKFLKLIRALMAKGFATAEEKAQVALMFKDLDADEQETVKEDVKKVEGLSEENPAAKSDEEEIAKGVRELVKSHAKAAVAEAKAAVEEIKTEVQSWLKQQAELREKKSGIYHPEVQ